MTARRVYLETFGCQMNELDSELVAGQLRALGYSMTEQPEGADILLYNTCSVRDLAEQKVRSRLGEVRKRKASEPGLVVGVMGCMAERDGEAMYRQFPVVDILCGPAELDKLPSLIDNAVRTRDALSGDHAHEKSAKETALQGDSSRRSSTLAAAADSLETLDLSRAISPTDHNGSAYVRITRGCNKFCTYCVVPHTRGAEIHRPPDHILDECKKLEQAGVLEITLLGQTVNHYRYEHTAAVSIDGVEQPQKGRSFSGGHTRDPLTGANTTTFADLLKRIHDECQGVRRLRFVTSYPRDFGDDVLEVIRDSPRICRYLHIPVQSGSDAMLKRMNRGYTIAQYLEFIERAKAHLHQPEIGRPLTLASDIIVGFCAETEDDFRQTCDLLERVRFKNNFIFKYSPRPGTTAFDRLPDDVPHEVKKRRCNELMAIQQRISDEVSREQVGHEFDVFVEGVSFKQRKKRKTTGGAVALTVGGRQTQGEPTHVVEPGPVQMSARTDGDLIVVFDCPEGSAPDDLVGTIRRVRIDDAKGLTLSATLI